MSEPLDLLTDECRRLRSEIEQLRLSPYREEGEGNSIKVNSCARCGNIYRNGEMKLAVNVEVCHVCIELMNAQAEIEQRDAMIASLRKAVDYWAEGAKILCGPDRQIIEQMPKFTARAAAIRAAIGRRDDGTWIAAEPRTEGSGEGGE